MKLQCSCGAKFAFEITPEMKSNPVRFVCPVCGLDASEFVDGLIRQELGQASSPAGRVVPIGATAETSVRTTIQSVPETAAPPARLRVRIDAPAAPASGQLGPATTETQDLPRCPKHPSQVAAERCYVCSKPICPKCMELFGYVCSPLCKAKADSHGIQVPLYAGQRALVEARLWRRTRRAAWGFGTAAVALLGFWFWYAWFGSMPKVVFSIRFPCWQRAGCLSSRWHPGPA